MIEIVVAFLAGMGVGILVGWLGIPALVGWYRKAEHRWVPSARRHGR